MARSMLRLGPVHVVVVAGSPALREAIAAWLGGVKRVRIVRTAASAKDLDGQRIECDLVVASGLEGSRELRAIGKRIGSQAGLVALTLGTTPLPAGWAGVRPGASRTHVLDHARAHPERNLAASGAVLSALAVATAAAVAAFLYVPRFGVSFERAALAYAERYPDTSVWWHVWGSGGPLLASSSWPLIKGAALTGLGPAAFVLLAALAGAVLGIALQALVLRAGARRSALALSLVVVIGPALWVWPRGGDVGSLVGLTGVVLALAGSVTRNLRVLATALAVAVSSFGGVLWMAAAVVAAIASAVRSRQRRRATFAGVVFGVLASAAVTLPPVAARGLEGLRPSLARTPAASDLVPVLATVAVVLVVLARGRLRVPALGVAAALLVAGNALALVVPVHAPEPSRIPTSGAFGRLAVHPAEALAIVTSNPDVPTTGDEVPAEIMVGAGGRTETNALLERLGADRARTPDRTSAIIFNERDWAVLDRDRLLFAAPIIRPILTAGITPTVLLIADEADARVFGEAMAAVGAATERLITVWSPRPVDELDLDFLQEFTMVAVYGRPWTSAGRASDLLQRYLDGSGFILMDIASRPGSQILGMPDAVNLQRSADEYRVVEEVKDDALPLVTLAAGADGRVVAMDQWRYRDDAAWELATVRVGTERVLQFGATKVAGEALAAHMLWSGLDLPARAAAGDEAARDQLERAIQWMLTDAAMQLTGPYGRPAGTVCPTGAADPRPAAGAEAVTCADVLDNATATSIFQSPTRWRVRLKVATTHLLFKERFHPEWRAYQVEQRVGGSESTTPLPIRPTVDGHMYVTLPPNARIVDFVFERHPLEAASRGVSAVATFVLLAISFFLWRRR